MCPFKPTLLALSTVALCACTTLPQPVSCPSPPEMLMRPPQTLRSLPSPEPLPPTTRPATRTPSNCVRHWIGAGRSVRLQNPEPILATEPEGRPAAIVDFTFNLGTGRLQTSTLRRRVNQRDWGAAGRELRRWIYGGGKMLPGLIKRREVEAAQLLCSG